MLQTPRGKDLDGCMHGRGYLSAMDFVSIVCYGAHNKYYATDELSSYVDGLTEDFHKIAQLHIELLHVEITRRRSV